MELRKEILQAIEILPLNDRDLKSITICCNPNYERGSDKDLRVKVREILKRLVSEGKIKNIIEHLEIFTKNSNGKLQNIKIRLFSFIKNT